MNKLNNFLVSFILIFVAIYFALNYYAGYQCIQYRFELGRFYPTFSFKQPYEIVCTSMQNGTTLTGSLKELQSIQPSPDLPLYKGGSL